jgi:predicted nucleic acid-binding protein
MLAGSNIFIYATHPDYVYLIDWIIQNTPFICPITKVETLGYHLLQSKDKILLNELFNCLGCLYPTPTTFSIAIELCQLHKMTLGDSLIAATALEHQLTLATRNIDDFKWITSLQLVNPVDD